MSSPICPITSELCKRQCDNRCREAAMLDNKEINPAMKYSRSGNVYSKKRK